MKIKLRCNDCDEDIEISSVTVRNGMVEAIINPCPTCLLREREFVKLGLDIISKRESKG